MERAATSTYGAVNLSIESRLGGESVVAVSEGTRRLKAALDDAVWTLGIAMRERFEPSIAAQLGKTWFKVVQPSQGSFARDDFASYADCLLGANERTAVHRQLFRDVAGQPWSTYGTALKRAKKARNAIAHADTRPTRRSASELVGELVTVAECLSLNCVEALVAVDIAIQAGEVEANPVAQTVDESELEVLRAKLSDLETVQASIGDRAREADEQIKSRDDALIDAEERLEREKRQTRDLEARLASRDRDDADRAALESQIREQGRLVFEAQARADGAEAEVALARQERDHIAQSEAAAQRELNELRARAEFLPAAPLSETQPANTPSPDIDTASRSSEASDPPEARPIESVQNSLDEILRLIERRNQALAAAGSAQGDVADFPEPGEAWPYPRGTEIWTLSTSRQSLVRLGDGLDAGDLWPTEVAEAAVAQFLSLRPRGGRVWMDDDGDAATYLDGHLIYLGRITDFFEDDAEPSVGTPMAPSGRKYRINRVGIYRAADELSLSKVRTPAISRQVRERLLAVRPSGGVFRVGTDGVATTYLEGQWVYAGRVEDAEWFPGDVR